MSVELRPGQIVALCCFSADDVIVASRAPATHNCYEIRNEAAHLLNTTIIPAFPGAFTVYGGSLTAAEAANIIRFGRNGPCMAGSEDEGYDVPVLPRAVVSHIGHQSTADLMGAALGQPVAMDRTPWDGSGIGIVCALAFRGEEGRVYSAAEMADFEARGLVTWRWIVICRDRN